MTESIDQSEAAQFVLRNLVPDALREWANTLNGKQLGKKIIAGWEWDGRSPGIILILAPKGRAYRDAPLDVWRASL